MKQKKTYRDYIGTKRKKREKTLKNKPYGLWAQILLIVEFIVTCAHRIIESTFDDNDQNRIEFCMYHYHQGIFWVAICRFSLFIYTQRIENCKNEIFLEPGFSLFYFEIGIIFVLVLIKFSLHFRVEKWNFFSKYKRNWRRKDNWTFSFVCLFVSSSRYFKFQILSFFQMKIVATER